MGAWGVKPFASDGALDWLGSQVTSPLAKTIKETLERFLGYKKKERPVYLWDERLRVNKGRKGKRFSKAAMKELRKSQRKVTMMGRPSSHDEAEAAAALLDECTLYGTRWRLFDYSTWPERVKKARKRKGNGSTLFCNPIVGDRQAAPKWKSGKPPAVLPDGQRLIFDFSREKKRIRLNYEAEHMELYSLAARAVREIMDDDAYLSSWRNGSEKRAALRVLVDSLELKAMTEVHSTERKIADSLSFRRPSWRRRVSKKKKK